MRAEEEEGKGKGEEDEAVKGREAFLCSGKSRRKSVGGARTPTVGGAPLAKAKRLKQEVPRENRAGRAARCGQASVLSS